MRMIFICNTNHSQQPQGTGCSAKWAPITRPRKIGTIAAGKGNRAERRCERADGNCQRIAKLGTGEPPHTSFEARLVRRTGAHPTRSMDGFGYHEVIIDTPVHDRVLSSM
jgi:hypothetical protein